ncbi:MAG: hypothetical protein MJE12_09855 [Alphaproteobacteria bacterium]|nr:hypothetical protein [Alphaproteobacteria bacterium]
MAADVAVAIIHGMGAQESDFADDTIEELEDNLTDLGYDPDRVAFESVYWADILQPRQRQYVDDAIAAGDIDFVSFRRFVVGALGDASAYRRIGPQATSTYDQVNARVADTVTSLEQEVVHPRTPLIVLAHSLGAHIISCYIWDMQRPGAAAGLSHFRAMKTHAGMITFGCNIPLFTFAYDPADLKPIKFPGTQLRQAHKSLAKWINFYDRDDILGYPLEPLNAAYAALVEDRAINAGSILTSWNPLSHGGYWTDNDVTEPAAEYIARFL